MNYEGFPRISIITVCYNSEATIARTIESVLNQTYRNFEYIIIDGKSKDNTINVINSYKDKFASASIELTIISEPDDGIYYAMNKGIALAKGEIVGIINSDDWYENNALEVVANTYKETPFDMFYADLRIIKKNGKTIIKHSKKDRIITTRHWNHPTSFIAKKTYDELGTFILHSIYDDLDLYLRIRRANKNIVIKNTILANFTVGGISTKKSFKEANNRCKCKYWCYRNNGYSRWYWFECFFMEMAKTILS